MKLFKILSFISILLAASVSFAIAPQMMTNSYYRGIFSVDNAAYAMLNADYVDHVGLLAVSKQDAVAEIDGYSYDSIQAAVDAAVSRGDATVDIIKSVTLSKPLSIMGNGIESTYVVLNIHEGVTVTFIDREVPGILIDNADVRFAGEGTWFKFSNDPDYPTKTMVCIGERPYKCGLAPANVVVTSGTFDCGHSNVFRVKNGSITIADGTFKIRLGTTRYCVVIEPSDIKDCLGNVILGGTAHMQVIGGTFITPKDSQIPPCGVKSLKR